MFTSRFGLFVANALLLALMLAACGGDGISEKQLYYDVAAAEDRAELEARKQANGCLRGGLDLDVEKYTVLLRPLQERYRDAVLEEYGVSQEQWREILLEGSEERWNVPKPLTCG